MTNEELEQHICVRVDEILKQNHLRLKEWEQNALNNMTTNLLATLKDAAHDPVPLWQAIIWPIIEGVATGAPVAIMYYFLR